ncbi:hypothetical protein N2152v2_009271 [Parachlorella kessleri]
MQSIAEQQKQKQEQKEALQGAGEQGQPQACQLAAHRRVAPREPRPNLVLVPVGDTFNASKWVRYPELANFDLIVLYYGTNASYQCSVCTKVFHAPGTKWKLVYSLYTMRHWRQLAQGYRAVMVADDDLDMDTCVISRAFDVFHEYGLLMAQPSICRRPGVHSNWELLYQRPSFVLRFTSFVEIMAPIFDMDLYNGLIAPSCYNAHFGWALDFVWPFLLRYPQDKVAVIDEVCMGHPPSNSKQSASLYAAPAPFSASEEGRRREREFGYVPWRVQQLGYTFHPVQELGAVVRLAGEPPPANHSTELRAQIESWGSTGAGGGGSADAQVHDVGAPTVLEGKFEALGSAAVAAGLHERADVPPTSGGAGSSRTGDSNTGGGAREASQGGGSLSTRNASSEQTPGADQARLAAANAAIPRPGWDDLEHELLMQISQTERSGVGAEDACVRLLTLRGLPGVGLLWQVAIVTACVAGAWGWQRGRKTAADVAREDSRIPTPAD